MVPIVSVGSFLGAVGHSSQLRIHSIRVRIDEARTAGSHLGRQGHFAINSGIVDFFVRRTGGEDDLAHAADNDERAANKLEGGQGLAEQAQAQKRRLMVS